MKTGNKGIALIKSKESLKLQAYKCPAGIWTIGWGHTGNVCPGDKITYEVAESLLRSDIGKAEPAINALNVDLTQNQYDALVSFVFNCGVGNFASSTLRKKVLKDPNDKTIRDEFNKWVHAKDKVLEGLVTRRKEEADLYFSNDTNGI
jgi:lysozyme